MLFRATRSGPAGLVVLGVVVAAALLAPWLADSEALRAVNTVANPVWAGPGDWAPLGTDNLGRPIWVQLLFGARISLLVGVASTAVAIGIGLTVGLVAGFIGGWVDALLARFSEWFLVIPFIPLAIVLAAVLGPSLKNIIVVIGITSWPVTARLIRAQVLTLKERLYVERSRVLGASSVGAMVRHVLPNAMPLVIANTTLTVPIAILSETTLAFLGLGDPTRVSWGKMLEESFEAGSLTREAWWYYAPPGVCVVIVVLAFTMVGRALETVLDPRLRERRA